jgi:zinc-ribbon domain
MAIVCTHCGRDINNPEARFCGACGTSIPAADLGAPREQNHRSAPAQRGATAVRNQKSGASFQHLVIGAIVVGVLGIIGLFVYSNRPAPCDSIFQQTVPKLSSSVQFIKTHGELVIGSEKVQELSENSQRVGILCKTCCIANQNGKINAEQFQTCLDTTKQYQTQVLQVADTIGQASAAKARGDTQAADQKASQAIADATAVTSTVDKLSAVSGAASGAAASPTKVEPNQQIAVDQVTYSLLDTTFSQYSESEALVSIKLKVTNNNTQLSTIDEGGFRLWVNGAAIAPTYYEGDYNLPGLIAKETSVSFVVPADTRAGELQISLSKMDSRIHLDLANLAGALRGSSPQVIENGLTYALLGASLAQKRPSESLLQIKLKITNNGTDLGLVEERALRLWISGAAIAPTDTAPDYNIPGLVARETTISFPVPADTRIAELQINPGNPKSRMRLELAAADK